MTVSLRASRKWPGRDHAFVFRSDEPGNGSFRQPRRLIAGPGHADQKTFDGKTEDADPKGFGAAFNP